MGIIDRILFELDREGQKMSVLCQYLGIGTSTMANWKTRHTDPPAKYIAPICEFLKLPIDYILTGKKSEKKLASGLTEDEQKILTYYEQLTDEQKDYVKGEMARLNMENKRDTEFAAEKAT